MIRRLNENELKERAWEVLTEHLGPVEAMRFLSLIRARPRDYQAWRDERFKDLTDQGLIEELRRIDSGRSGANRPTSDG